MPTSRASRSTGSTLPSPPPGGRPTATRFGRSRPRASRSGARSSSRGACGATSVPWVLVTGTNGKTTTVQMVGSIAREAGLRCAVVGNVGEPVVRAAQARPRSGRGRGLELPAPLHVHRRAPRVRVPQRRRRSRRLAREPRGVRGGEGQGLRERAGGVRLPRGRCGDRGAWCAAPMSRRAVAPSGSPWAPRPCLSWASSTASWSIAPSMTPDTARRSRSRRSPTLSTSSPVPCRRISRSTRSRRPRSPARLASMPDPSRRASARSRSTPTGRPSSPASPASPTSTTPRRRTPTPPRRRSGACRRAPRCGSPEGFRRVRTSIRSSGTSRPASGPPSSSASIPRRSSAPSGDTHRESRSR